jgi:hypothetical protein
MPNWCHNNGEIQTTNWETAKSIVDHAKKGTLLNWIKPAPQEFMDIHSGSACYKDDNGEEHRVDFWYDVPFKAGLGWSRYVERPGFKSFPGGWGKGRIAPIPQVLQTKWRCQYGTMGWYDWNINNWGTKWDVCDVSYAEITTQTDHIAPPYHIYTVELTFETAWSPPERAYETLWERDDIHYMSMYYEEPGMEFKGYWENGEDKPEEWQKGYCDECDHEVLLDDGDELCTICGTKTREVVAS